MSVKLETQTSEGLEVKPQNKTPIVRDWGEVNEGHLSVFGAVAKCSKEMWDEPTKSIVIKFRYTPAQEEVEEVFSIPESWGEDQIKEFEEALWALMAIY